MMNIDAIKAIEQVELFLQGTSQAYFQLLSKQESYKWLEAALNNFSYGRRSKREKGLLRAYMGKVTGYSRSQLMRLITKHRKHGKVFSCNYVRNKFSSRYTHADVLLLAETDKLHNNSTPPSLVMSPPVKLARTFRF